MKAATCVTLLLVPLLVGACDSILGDDEGEVELSVDGVAFVAGDDVQLRVHNGSDETVFFNGCFLQMDVRSGSEWAGTDYIGGLPCIALDPFWPGLAPGTSMTLPVILPDTVPTGTYRLRLGVWEDEAAHMELATRGFDVQGRSATGPE